MMAVGTSVAVVCGDSVADSAQRKHLFVRTLYPFIFSESEVLREVLAHLISALQRNSAHARNCNLPRS